MNNEPLSVSRSSTTLRGEADGERTDSTIWPRWMEFGRQLPLSTLLSVLTFATLLPFLALGSYVLASWLMEERAKEIQRVSAIAADLARAVDRELRGQIETAQVVASTRVLQNGDIAAFSQIAEDAASKANGHFILIDRNYQQLVNTRTIAGTPLPKTANQQGAQQIFDTGKILVGNLVKGAVAQKLLYSVRVPVTVQGEVRYVLSFVPREGAIVDVVNQAYRPEGWFASVTDGNGRIIARSYRHAEFYGKNASPEVWAQMKEFSGSLVTRDLEGREAVSAFNGSLLSNWKVIVWAPKALLEEPVWKASRLMLMLAGLAIAGSLIVAYFTGRLIAKPTEMLLGAARHLGAGEPVSFSPTIMKEANVVGEAMREAAGQIRAREEELRKNEKERRMVMRELSHRSKNLLAVIQAMVSNSLRISPDPQQFRENLTERLAGLARSHDLLIKTDWGSVSLAELISTQLSAFDDPKRSRVSAHGPKVLLSPHTAQHLGMAFHELATNALKYGALSSPEGRIAIEWAIKQTREGDILLLRWQESGGPPVIAPQRRGFGSTVIERLVPSTPGSSSRVDWLATGLVWELELNLMA